MSIIIPAGNKKLDWSPKAADLQKTASVQDDLYKAAQDFMTNLDKDDECETCGAPECSCTDVPVDMGVTEVADVSTNAPAATIEEAVKKVDEAVTELKDVANVETSGDEETVDIEIVDEEVKPEEVGKDVEVEIDIPGEKEKDGDVVVESKEKEACSSEKKEEKKDESCPKEIEMDKSASSEEKFCRIAELSPNNRKKLAEYWSKVLGYPKDYVDLMVKDYEK